MISTEVRSKIMTSLLVALFFSLTLFLFGPYRTFLHNITEFNINYYRVSWYFIILALLAFIVLFTLMLLTVKKAFHQKIVSCLFILSVLIWLNGNVLIWNHGALNGTNLLLNENFKHGIIELLIWVLLISVSFCFYLFIYKIARIASILLVLTQVICIAYEKIQLPCDIYWGDYVLDINSKSFYRYSEDKNIVILLLDSFPSYMFQEIIEEDLSYNKIFDGFTYYRNSLSGYPNTKASIANILTGKFYKNSEFFYKFIEDSFRQNSLPVVLLKNGYQVDAFEEFNYFCYFNVFSNCVPSEYSSEEIYSEFAVLNQITLFRSFPHFIKKLFAFNNPGKSFITRDILAQANSIVNKLYVDKGKPVFKFYHFFAPHPPITFNEKLQYQYLDVNRENYLRYAKGSLKIAKMFLDKLKESGIYDNTMIFVISDHGYDWLIKKKGVYEASEVDARALPLVLIKPFRERGKMMISDAPVHLQDIPATVMSALGLKEKFPGCSIFELKDSTLRKRSYLQYNTTDGSEIPMYMPFLYEYIVQGFSWSGEFWQTSGKIFKPKCIFSKEQSDLIITADKSNINSPPEFVNRSSSNYFWEASGGYPYWIKFEFASKAEKVTRYSLKTGIHEGATEEMPKDWQFQSSNDGVNWETLDVRHDQTKWKPDEKRTCNVVNNNEYKYYRLYFEQGNRPDYIRIYEILLVE